MQSSMPLLCLFLKAVINYIFECYQNAYLSKRNKFTRVYFLRFAQDTVNAFQNAVLNSYRYCLRQMPQRQMPQQQVYYSLYHTNRHRPTFHKNVKVGMIY